MKKLLFLTILLLLGTGRAESFPSLSIIGSAGHFFSGDQVERTLVIAKIPAKFTAVTLIWETSVPPAVIQRGEIKRKWSPEPGAIIFPVILNLPQVKRRTELIWKIRLFLDGRESFSQEVPYSVFPRAIPCHLKTILSGRRVGLVDSKGEIGRIFQYLDVPFMALKSQLSLETFPGDLIIIGPRALSPRILQFTLRFLQEKVKQGLSILCFEPGNLSRFLLPLQTIPAGEPISLSSAKISAPGHPVFQGIKKGDLSRWQGGRIIGSAPYQLPQGNFKALVRSDDLSGDAASPLIEVPYGQGKYIFSQLAVIEKFKQEPVARLFFENLIRYALMKQKPLQPAAIYGNPKSEMTKVINSLKVAGLRNPISRDGFHFVIICADRELTRLKEPGFSKRLKQFVRQGGILIIFGFARENLNLFEEIIPSLVGEILPTPLSIKKGKPTIPPFDKGGKGGISLDRNNPLLWGITKDDIKRIFKVKNFLNLKAGKKVKLLIKPGALVKIKEGKGQVILCRIQFKEDEKPGLRLLSQLLTNLGIEIEQATWNIEK